MKNNELIDINEFRGEEYLGETTEMNSADILQMEAAYLAKIEVE